MVYGLIAAAAALFFIPAGQAIDYTAIILKKMDNFTIHNYHIKKSIFFLLKEKSIWQKACTLQTAANINVHLLPMV